MPPTRRETDIDTLERAITEMRRSSDALQNGVDLLHAAIFGRPDADPSKSLPGLQEEVRSMSLVVGTLKEAMIDAKDQLSATTEKVDRLRWWIGGGMAAATALLSGLDVIMRTHLK